MPVVYLVDERISGPRAVLDNVPEVDRGFLINPYTPIAEIVSTVLDGLNLPTTGASSGRGVSAAPMITGLRIMAHGDREQLFLGRGIDARNAVQLKPLAAIMRGGASGQCLLLGCNAASGAPLAERFLGGAATGDRIVSPWAALEFDETVLRGEAAFPLLYALARTLGVPVTAGLNAQTSAFDWHFAGSTVTVDSFGEVKFSGMDTPRGA